MSKAEKQYYLRVVLRGWTCPRQSCHCRHSASEIRCGCGMFHPDVAKEMKHRPYQQQPPAQAAASAAAPPPNPWQAVGRRSRSRQRPAATAGGEAWPLPQQSAAAAAGKPVTQLQLLPGTPKAGAAAPAQKTAALASPGKSSPAPTVVEPRTPETPPMDGSVPLSAEQRAHIQQELAQLVTSISALKPIPGYEQVVRELEEKRHTLQKQLHFAKPVRARVEALRAATQKRTQAIEEANQRHQQAVLAVAAAEKLVETTADEQEAAELALAEIQAELTQAEALLAHEDASANGMPDPTLLLQQVLLAQANNTQLPPEGAMAAAKLVGPPPANMVATPVQSPFLPAAQPVGAQQTGLVNTPFAQAIASQQHQCASMQAAAQLIEAQRLASMQAAATGVPAVLLSATAAAAHAAAVATAAAPLTTGAAPSSGAAGAAGGTKREEAHDPQESPLQPTKLQARMDHEGKPMPAPAPSAEAPVPPIPASVAAAAAPTPAQAVAPQPTPTAVVTPQPLSKMNRFASGRATHGGYVAAPSAGAEVRANRSAGPY